MKLFIAGLIGPLFRRRRIAVKVGTAAIAVPLLLKRRGQLPTAMLLGLLGCPAVLAKKHKGKGKKGKKGKGGRKKKKKRDFYKMKPPNPKVPIDELAIRTSIYKNKKAHDRWKKSMQVLSTPVPL